MSLKSSFRALKCSFKVWNKNSNSFASDRNVLSLDFAEIINPESRSPDLWPTRWTDVTSITWLWRPAWCPWRWRSSRGSWRWAPVRASRPRRATGACWHCTTRSTTPPSSPGSRWSANAARPSPYGRPRVSPFSLLRFFEEERLSEWWRYHFGNRSTRLQKCFRKNRRFSAVFFFNQNFKFRTVRGKFIDFRVNWWDY